MISGTFRFYPVDSFWRRRDSRVKLGVLFSLSLLVFLEAGLWWQGLIFILIGVLFITASLPISLFTGTIRSFRFLLGLTFLANLLFIRDGQRILGLPVTNLGLTTALAYLLRLTNLIMLGSWLMAITPSLEMIKGIEGLLSPVKRIVPVGEIALVFGIAFRFSPLLLQEAEEISLAQRARGVSFEGSWRRKIKGILSMVIPLFVSALRRATDLAQAMEARGYVPGAIRGSYQASTWKRADTLTLVISLLLLLALVVLQKGWYPS